MSGIQQLLVSGGISGKTLMQVITDAGLTTNLQLCLDAGDPASYTSGQSWLDRSGNGYDFFLGADGSATATDPTFTGSVGYLGAYWSFDGGDYFTYDTTNETWMQNLHKNNAAFTVLAIIYFAGNIHNFIGDQGNSPSTGFLYKTQNTGRQQLLISNADATVASALTTAGGESLVSGSYNMVGVSLNETTGVDGAFFYKNGSYHTVASSDKWDSTYTAPSVGNASNTMNIGALGGGLLPAGSGDRIACLAAWSTALTKANLDTIWAAMRGRFGI